MFFVNSGMGVTVREDDSIMIMGGDGFAFGADEVVSGLFTSHQIRYH